MVKNNRRAGNKALHQGVATSERGTLTRREFLKASAVAAGGLALSACGRRGLGKASADLVLYNGKIITVDARDTIAGAVAVSDGLIEAVGKDQTELQGYIGPETSLIDLQGATVTPGLVDSHIHVIQYGKQTWSGFTDIRMPNVSSRDDLIRVLKEAVAQAEPGEWISGNQGFIVKFENAPKRQELDEIAPDNPVYLRHMGGQYAVVNSAALELAGIDANTPNPPGGLIYKDKETGEPTGVLSHYSAENLVGRYAPGWGERSDEELMDDVRRGQADCLAVGYTSGQDVIVSTARDVEAYKNVAQNNDLLMRMYLVQYVSSAAHAKEEIKNAQKFRRGMVTFGGWKMAVDGGVSAGTALMYDTSMPMSKAAYPYYKQETLNQMVTVMHQAGYQTSFHCVGDQAIDMAINAIEAALKAEPRDDHRHRIEHLLFPTDEAIERIKDLGIIISTQPNWLSMLGDFYKPMCDEATMARFIQLRKLLDKGIRLAFGCDVPATPYIEPNWTFAGAVTRTTWQDNVFGPDQAISMEEALRIHTMGSAYASFEEEVKGSIETGKAADMVVWSHDLLTLDPKEDLVDLKPLKTIVAGQVVYEAG